jgi:hypothetical protein
VDVSGRPTITHPANNAGFIIFNPMRRKPYVAP